MLLPIKAVIKKKPRKDGTHPIYFQYCFSSSNRVLLGTDIAVPSAFWNGKRQNISKLLPPEKGDFEGLNNELNRQRKVVEAIVEHGMAQGMPDVGAYVKNTFTPQFDLVTLATAPAAVPVKKKEPDFFKEAEAYIRSKEKKVCPKALSNLKSMKDHLYAFEKFRRRPVTFQSLDYDFYCDFVDFLTYDFLLPRKKEPTFGLRVSTIGKTIKQLRVFINDRVRRKIIAPISMVDFKIVDEEADAVYLPYDEIERIYSLDLSHDPTFDQYRDMFVLGCLTGLRFSDYSTLKLSDLRGDLLYKKTDKKDSWVIIPLRLEAAKIFPKRFAKQTPIISNAVFNRYIKEIAELAGISQPVTFSHKKGNKDIVVTKPKSQWVTSHTCRRSFATNEYLAGTDVSLIMKITGHKTHKDFFKYIRVTEEEAARKIHALWLSRDNMTAFQKAGRLNAPVLPS